MVLDPDPEAVGYGTVSQAGLQIAGNSTLAIPKFRNYYKQFQKIQQFQNSENPAIPKLRNPTIPAFQN